MYLLVVFSFPLELLTCRLCAYQRHMDSWDSVFSNCVSYKFRALSRYSRMMRRNLCMTNLEKLGLREALVEELELTQ